MSVIKFLLGEDSLDGLWFGDAKDYRLFWWRKHLQEYVESKDKEIQSLTEQLQKANEAIARLILLDIKPDQNAV